MKKNQIVDVDALTGEIISSKPQVYPTIRQKYIGVSHATPEVNTEPSLTVPNEALSVQEILSRFTRNMPITAIQRKPVYNGDKEVPDLDRMDISEKYDLLNSARSEVAYLQKLDRDTKAAKAAEDLEKKVEAKIAAKAAGTSSDDGTAKA